MIVIRNIDHVVIRAADIDRAVAFYCDVLGCVEARRVASIGLVQLRAGSAMIDLIDASQTPLTLEALAGEMNMSPAHFQRLFSKWVGVSPKRYQQYLALGHAKALLRERFTTLAAADGAGLSGGGRLHDLFLRWEAMSPGDYGAGGAGLLARRISRLEGVA